MLYELVSKKRGHETVVCCDELSKVRGTMKQLRDSQRGMKVTYSIREAQEGEDKKERKPHRFRSH
jgi:hypothetical protein